MPTYNYYCDVHKEVEYEHSIKDKIDFCPKCKELGIESKMTRLISLNSGFILGTGGVGWAKEGYSK